MVRGNKGRRLAMDTIKAMLATWLGYPPKVLTGANFERIMAGLEPDAQTPETAQTIMLVAAVTDMSVTAGEDLEVESADRQKEAEDHTGQALKLRAIADVHDRSAESATSRKAVVDHLRVLLP